MFSELQNSAKKWGDCLCVCVEFSFDAFLFVHHCDDLFLQPNILNIIIRSSRKKAGKRKHHILCAHISTEMIKIEIIV